MLYLSLIILVYEHQTGSQNSVDGIKISRFSTNISRTTQNNILVTIEREEELVYKLSNGVHFR